MASKYICINIEDNINFDVVVKVVNGVWQSSYFNGFVSAISVCIEMYLLRLWKPDIWCFCL